MLTRKFEDLDTYEIDRHPEDKELFEVISRWLNMHSGVDEGYRVARAMCGDHRTLQQNLWRHLIVPLIDLFAQQWEMNWFDDRNAASCKLAFDIREGLKAGRISEFALFPPPLPFI